MVLPGRCNRAGFLNAGASVGGGVLVGRFTGIKRANTALRTLIQRQRRRLGPAVRRPGPRRVLLWGADRGGKGESRHAHAYRGRFWRQQEKYHPPKSRKSGLHAVHTRRWGGGARFLLPSSAVRRLQTRPHQAQSGRGSGGCRAWATARLLRVLWESYNSPQLSSELRLQFIHVVTSHLRHTRKCDQLLWCRPGFGGRAVGCVLLVGTLAAPFPSLPRALRTVRPAPVRDTRPVGSQGGRGVVGTKSPHMGTVCRGPATALKPGLRRRRREDPGHWPRVLWPAGHIHVQSPRPGTVLRGQNHCGAGFLCTVGPAAPSPRGLQPARGTHLLGAGGRGPGQSGLLCDAWQLPSLGHLRRPPTTEEPSGHIEIRVSIRGLCGDAHRGPAPAPATGHGPACAGPLGHFPSPQAADRSRPRALCGPMARTAASCVAWDAAPRPPGAVTALCEEARPSPSGGAPGGRRRGESRGEGEGCGPCMCI